MGLATTGSCVPPESQRGGIGLPNFIRSFAASGLLRYKATHRARVDSATRVDSSPTPPLPRARARVPSFLVLRLVLRLVPRLVPREPIGQGSQQLFQSDIRSVHARQRSQVGNSECDSRDAFCHPSTFLSPRVLVLQEFDGLDLSVRPCERSLSSARDRNSRLRVAVAVRLIGLVSLTLSVGLAHTIRMKRRITWNEACCCRRAAHSI